MIIPAIDLWLEYVQFSIGICNTEEAREIFEKGISAIGLHVKDGELIWDNLREFELIHLSANEENTEQWTKQLNRISDIFKRQLSVPLMNMETTYEEFREFKEKYPQIDEKPIEYGYKKALKLLQLYKTYEDQLLIATEETKRIEIYQEYIKHAKDPSLVMNLYERAVLESALNGNLWNDYCLFAMKLNCARTINERALRNCPWYEELWVTKLRMLESENDTSDAVVNSFEEGIQSIQPNPGLELWLTYFEYFNRNVKDIEKLKTLYEQASLAVKEHDASCTLMRFAARIFAMNQNVEMGRKIWSNVIFKLGKTANAYLEYAAFERQYGDVKNLRVTFQKAINTCTDYPKYVADEWLLYERQLGTLQDVFNCMQKIREIQPASEVKPNRNKRKHEAILEPKSKRPKPEIEIKEPVTSNNFDPNLTVFVSNLAYDVNETHLKKFFPKATNVFKPPDKKKGVSRCFAYVTFATPEEVATALARDRERLDDRPVFISECKSDRTQRQPQFKYATNAEKNKLFVRGLPFITDQQAVENIFKQYDCTSVRLVTKKNGQSKGCAYVDFTNEEAAQKALEATNGINVGDRVIEVAISNPPPPGTSGAISEFKEPFRNARSKLSVPLIPRGVQLKQKQENGKEKETVPVKKSNDDFRKMFLS